MDVIINIPDQVISGIVVSAIEDGIRYWCDQVIVKSRDRLWVTFREADGGALIELHPEDWPSIVGIMATKAPRHFANMVGDTADAETGDVLVQLACFGELKYG